MDKANNNGATPWFLAAQNGFAEVGRALLQKRADASKAMQNGETPLTKGADNSHPKMVRVRDPRGEFCLWSCWDA